ncbi:nucleotidyltransferase domain-containing protein [Candidatus Methylocalor cossyra]|uniref:Nucleotidyltransferase family protein n=1 Tax=Candidatus Methylocalor cossyra TaxID=3108543 RepID=A0ABP1CBM5_9GAMM
MSPAPAIPGTYRRMLELLAEPAAMVELTEPEWDALLPLSRATRLFSRLAALAAGAGLLARLPAKVQDHMAAALRWVAHRRQKILWELYHLERALEGIETPIVVLKGAGYLLAGLRVAEGRTFADVDLLLSRESLIQAERALRDGGWQAPALDDYDQRYYRAWMHELPPLRHPERQVEVDLHHTLAPPTGRIKVDPAPLLAAAVPLAGSRFWVPGPADMVLHSALHLFYGGEFDHGLRDLSDLDLLMREFGARDPGFWPALVDRATALGLGRPLAYALRYTQRLFRTPVPEPIVARADRLGPPKPLRRVMDALFETALTPRNPAAVEGASAQARRLLWIRSHWLKMPPGLLLSHALHKIRKGKKARL